VRAMNVSNTDAAAFRAFCRNRCQNACRVELGDTDIGY
jgi:endogenous inhibitor of DNA gyrase (YacG/DUF329 family)